MKHPSKHKKGQSVIEFALVLPFLLLLIVNVVNFGAFLYAGIAVANAARTGADKMMIGPAYLGYQTFPSVAAITNVVSDDIASLPNHATATVTVCSNNNGAVEAPYNCLASVTDPQVATSVVGQVTVRYNYTALIPLWDFPGLGVHATLMPTTITRVATTRLIQ
jgi:Flp pilus assembly protein TadG